MPATRTITLSEDDRRELETRLKVLQKENTSPRYLRPFEKNEVAQVIILTTQRPPNPDGEAVAD